MRSRERNRSHFSTRTRRGHRSRRPRSPAPTLLLAAALALGVGLIALAVAAWTSGAAAEAWWWLTNRTPPTIEAAVPPGPVRATIATRVTVRPAGGRGGAALRDVRLDGAPLPRARPDGELEIDTARLPDGQHVIYLEAADTSRRRNYATLELRFTSDNTAPTVGLEGLPASMRAGQPAAVRLTPSEPADVSAEWDGQPLPLVTAAGAVRFALLATAPTRPAGAIPLVFTARDAAGNTATDRRDVAVEPTMSPRQNLVVPVALAPLATGAVATAEAAQLAALTTAVRPERLWSGEFRAPLSGVRTTGFGDRRDYADGYVAAHGGYDVAAPLGAPVAASAAGTVVFAGPLQQRGTTVVLDHGWGVSSVYAHLSEAHVQLGASVAQGQTVGMVGNTGLSTGPHLHWEIRVRGQPVDPDTWIALSRTL